MQQVRTAGSSCKLLLFKSSTEQNLTILAKEMNVNIFQAWSKMMASRLYLFCAFTVWITVYCKRKTHLYGLPLIHWHFIQISQKFYSQRRRVSGLGSSSQWEGGSPKSSSLTRNLLTLDSQTDSPPAAGASSPQVSGTSAHCCNLTYRHIDL